MLCYVKLLFYCLIICVKNLLFYIAVELAFLEVPNVQTLKLGSDGLILCEPKPGVEVPVKWTKNSVQLAGGQLP